MESKQPSATIAEAGTAYSHAVIRYRLRSDSSLWKLIALLFALFLCYLPQILYIHIGHLHDDGLYLLTARSLAEGRGYRILSLPGEPLQTKYPILFPSLLALLWKINPHFPANAVLFKIVNNFIWLGALAWAYKLFVRFRYTTPTTALIIIALWGTTREAFSNTTALMSEPLYTLLSVATLWFAEHLFEDQSEAKKKQYAVLCGLFAGLAYLTRTAGILTIFALLGVMLLQHRRSILPVLVSASPFVILWSLWERKQTVLPFWDYREYYIDYTGWTVHQLHEVPLVQTVIVNIVHIFCLALPNIPFHLVTPREIDALASHHLTFLTVCFGLLVFVTAFYGGKRLCEAKRLLVPAVVLCVLLPLVVYPWEADRFLLPLGGFILLLMVEGLRGITSKLAPEKKGLVQGSICLLLVLGGVKDLRYAATLWHYQDTAWDQASQWVKTNIPPGDKLLAMNDTQIYMESGHQGISDRSNLVIRWSLPDPLWVASNGSSADADKQVEMLRQMHVRWLLDIDTWDSREFGRPNLLVSHPEWFEQVASLGVGKLQVYRVRGREETAANKQKQTPAAFASSSRPLVVKSKPSMQAQTMLRQPNR